MRSAATDAPLGVTVPSCTPMASSSERHASDTSVLLSSTSRWKWTSRMAARFLGPLHVTPDPVERFRYAREHTVTCLTAAAAAARSGHWSVRPAPRGSSSAASCTVVGSSGWATSRGRQAPRCPSSRRPGSSSRPLLPRRERHACEPAGHDPHFVPSLTANGRRSTWRGTTAPSTFVGIVEGSTEPCAMKPRGLSLDARLQRSSVTFVAPGPITMP